ncbi:uncharacterized protein L969DRAFT_21252 [Mixia osmundae IAM 14324]|uniref:RRM domain-containing protein n=1 Tax=Mixia osmundae (strain CBS 9802 / IAM 14324 / JCM 22182 / KY 12970) TaxID=764103 RepID=G7EAL1_MIXOS|nr:uncharacterized protein L969DRAFT_21252 [Mixia osmundae IAM 14324]KEI42361.1 hypothetical protein L969DRAFT_21252 [Mixia osmundae IAM 14324]GAA99871.1 hypothetical protein E5Q_06574 [Mixia osmundae IAM 14324]
MSEAVKQEDVEMKEAIEATLDPAAAASATEVTGVESKKEETKPESVPAEKEETAEEKQVRQKAEIAGASETIYINNLNETVTIKNMKQTLRNLFRNFGTVLDVVVHRNLRMRGQAFVAFEHKKSAWRAVNEVKDFPLYGKPMQLAYAKTQADALVKRKLPEKLDEHLAERKVRKKVSRRDNPIRQKALEARRAARTAAENAPVDGKAAAPAAAQRRIVQMPDEYLPPNKILFVQNLPDSVNKDALETLFTQFPNLSEVRMIPGRKGIAFVEFTDETSSGVAREALHNQKYEESKIKVTFARQ